MNIPLLGNANAEVTFETLSGKLMARQEGGNLIWCKRLTKSAQLDTLVFLAKFKLDNVNFPL